MQLFRPAETGQTARSQLHRKFLPFLIFFPDPITHYHPQAHSCFKSLYITGVLNTNGGQIGRRLTSRLARDVTNELSAPASECRIYRRPLAGEPSYGKMWLAFTIRLLIFARLRANSGLPFGPVGCLQAIPLTVSQKKHLVHQTALIISITLHCMFELKRFYVALSSCAIIFIAGVL